MRYGGVESAGVNFDYNAGTIKRKKEEEDDDPIRKAISAGSNFVHQIGNFLAQGITNPQQVAKDSGSSSAYNQ